MNKDELIADIEFQLRKIDDIATIVVGGSYATGAQRPDSDIDFGLYYRKSDPFEISDIRALANKLNDLPNPLVSDFGGWGYWINGGTWLTIKGQRVDFIYRNLDLVEKTIENCLNGKIESDFYQDPPAGFHNYIYLAEIEANQVFYDPTGIMTELKKRVQDYSPQLTSAIINKFLWDSEFTLSRARKFATRNEIYLTISSFVRISHDLVQVLYALNNKYFLSEKRAYKDTIKFNRAPKNFLLNVEKLLSNPGSNNTQLLSSLNTFSEFIENFKKLSKNIYTPKYNK